MSDFTKRRLPHIYRKGATFFITFRLKDSLSQVTLNELREEYSNKASKIFHPDPNILEYLLEELKENLFTKFQHQLDGKPFGECILKDPKCAEILYEKILQYNAKYYDLKCFCIMPNHVHILLRTLEPSGDNDDKNYVNIDKIMMLIKGGSSYLINKKIGKTGPLWIQESYDKIIKDETEYGNVFYYILNNPVKANLDKRYQYAPYMYKYTDFE